MHQADKRSVASVGSYVTFIDNNKNIQNIKGGLMSLETYAGLFGARCCDSSGPARSSALTLRDFPPVSHAALWPRGLLPQSRYQHTSETARVAKWVQRPPAVCVCVCLLCLRACVLSSTPGISVSLRFVAIKEEQIAGAMLQVMKEDDFQIKESSGNSKEKEKEKEK